MILEVIFASLSVKKSSQTRQGVKRETAMRVSETRISVREDWGGVSNRSLILSKEAFGNIVGGHVESGSGGGGGGGGSIFLARRFSESGDKRNTTICCQRL